MKPLLSLTAIGALCALLLAGTHRFTADDIEANRDAHAWRVAFELVGSEFPTTNLRWDGNRLESARWRSAAALVGQRLRGRNRVPRRDPAGTGRTDALAGVRVTRHRETPGLGDFIDTARSPWIHQFSDKLPDEVDAVTGATITSEAVKRGVSALAHPGASPALPGDNP